MYLDYIIFQIHQLFNEPKKAKVTCKCDPLMRVYIYMYIYTPSGHIYKQFLFFWVH